MAVVMIHCARIGADTVQRFLRPMPLAEQHRVVFKTVDDSTSPGELSVRVYSDHERLMRALKIWGLCWLFAVLSLPILGAHWFLVPGFLIAGPIMGYRRYHQYSSSDKVTGTCPRCHNEVSLSLEPREQLPLYKYCPQCSAPLHIVAAATGS